MTSAVTRFAPSPTGLLHLGSAYSALDANAASAGGRFLLRIEDIDQGRCKPEFEDAIFEDLAWLGLSWETPVRRQSEHFGEYKLALEKLERLGLLYPCFCTRADIRREIENAASAPHDHPVGPDGPIYPGTCRNMSPAERAQRLKSGAEHALRLYMDTAIEIAGPLKWSDEYKGEVKATPEIFGDVVLARKDTPISYHLACTWDDAAQEVSLVTRGMDLFASTHVHRLLQALLGLPTPTYRHHKLITNPDGKKFSKRDRSITIRGLRDAGWSKDQVIDEMSRRLK